MQNQPDVVANVIRIMNAQGLTPDDLVSTVAPASILAKTLGRQRYLDGSMLARLATALGVTIEELKEAY